MDINKIYNPNDYKYFDTPEGEDVVKKLWFATKYVAPAALGAGTVDVMICTQPKGYLHTIGRYVYVCAPIMGAAAAFIVTANIAANVRQKQDKINWFLGALPVGGIIGKVFKSTAGGITSCMFLGIAAMLTRTGLEEDWKLFFPAEHKKRVGGIWSHTYDYTLTKDRPIK